MPTTDNMRSYGYGTFVYACPPLDTSSSGTYSSMPFEQQPHTADIRHHVLACLQASLGLTQQPSPPNSPVQIPHLSPQEWQVLMADLCLKIHPTSAHPEPAKSATSSNPGLTLQPVLQRLGELAELGPAWDSYDAEPIAPQAVRSAQRIVEAAVTRFGDMVGQAAVPDPPLPVPDGGVHLQWSGSGAQLQLQISPDGVMHYLLIQQRGTDEIFTEDETRTETRIFELLEEVLQPS